MLFSGMLFSQEVLRPLHYNTALMEAASDPPKQLHTAENRDTLCLPFLDDFSNPNEFLDSTSTSCHDTIYHFASPVFPSSLFWMDSDAYINNNFAILPPSYGVATLDGLDKHGQPHNAFNPLGPADTMTSKPIYLGGPLTDSVYLSFYYQPGGFGDFPDANDSLVLEFKTSDGQWTQAWHVLNTGGAANQPFRLKMIAVPDSDLYDGFQFRFRNWANLEGNNDQWHIDYVYLNDNRGFNDTLFRDVAIIYEPLSYLKNYRQMPWTQFRDHQADEIAASHGVYMTNNYNTIINTSYQYEAHEKYAGDVIVPPTTPISINFDPFSNTVDNFDTFTIPPTVSHYDDDSMVLDFTYILNPSSDIYRRNDTLHYELPFYNYYAYDDGSAEHAYALEGTGAKLAIRFHANEPDTLREVYIHWAYLDGPKTGLFFSLMVWSSIDTTGATDDEDILYEQDFLTPEYAETINGFWVYKLTDFLGNPTPVVVDGDFYVGWMQTQMDFLNVGFDENDDAHADVFFDVGSSWEHSSIPGAIMIRPQVGGDYSKYFSNVQHVQTAAAIKVFPNPAHDVLHVETAGTGMVLYRIYNYAGALVKQTSNADAAIDIRELPPGFYILQANDFNSGAFYYAQFIRN